MSEGFRPLLGTVVDGEDNDAVLIDVIGVGGESLLPRQDSENRNRYHRAEAPGGSIPGPFGVDSDLRPLVLKLAERGGKNGKKRAEIATPRKPAVSGIP